MKNKTLQQWDEAAERYVLSQENSCYAAANREMVRRRFGGFEGETVLDLGCGAGEYTAYFSTVGARAVGCDGSRNMLAIARKKYPGCLFKLADIEKKPLPYPSREFDLVFSNLVFMDIADIESPLREVRRVLKPGGIFYMTIVHPAFYDAEWVPDASGFCGAKRMTRYLTAYSFDNAFWGKTTHYHRPVSTYVKAAVGADLVLIGMEEPPAYDGIAKSQEFPLFLVLEFAKPAGG